jgi:penicillin G amidase
MIRKLVIWSTGSVLVLVVVAATVAFFGLRASLPRDSGELTVTGIAAEVSITRDARGIATIAGDSLDDVAFGLGFVHAQERFFQMDLVRRVTSGELAALIGPGGLSNDQRLRPRGYREIARRTLDELPVHQQGLLDSYTAGVNAGLDGLGTRPPEYWLLNTHPEPWRVEDCLLPPLQFFDLLSTGRERRRMAGAMRDHLPGELVEFLLALQSRFDAPTLDPTSNDYQRAAIPGPETVDLRDQVAAILPNDLIDRTVERLPGSNAWAVSAERSTHAGAILASDPHLTLGLPSGFFQAQLIWPDGQAAGATTPGTPWLAYGSTERLAWGFTNGRGDLVDYVIIEVDPDNPGRYRTPEGWEAFTETEQSIAVRGQPDENLVVRSTRWGPVVIDDYQGRPLAMKSRIHEPGGFNLAGADLLLAATIDEAVAVLRRWEGSSLGAVLADADGRIAFALTGQFPNRFGLDPRWPASWADGTVGWNGLIEEARRPVLIDPPTGAVSHANQRIGPIELARQFGSAWSSPRAWRIAQMLTQAERFSEADMLAMQLDTRSPVQEFYRSLLLEIVDELEADARLRRARDQVAAWNGRSDADQVGFRILEAWRLSLEEALLAPLLEPVTRAHPDWRFRWNMVIEPIMRLLEERPAHLLASGHSDWTGFLRHNLAETLQALDDDPDTAPTDAPWGEANRLALHHPIAGRLPIIGRHFNIASRPMPGHTHSVRAQSTNYGAALRLVASPGQLDQALFHMPGGQSGHFLSPHYRSRHAAWAEGRPEPLLPGPEETRMRLLPETTAP